MKLIIDNREPPKIIKYIHALNDTNKINIEIKALDIGDYIFYDEITERIKGFNWGRYDIKYESFERLNIGEFHIIELNGDTQGLIPIIYPMNFDLAVYWSNNNIILSIYKLIEIIFYYYALCIKNLIMGKTGISDILMNINKWINNLKCY